MLPTSKTYSAYFWVKNEKSKKTKIKKETRRNTAAHVSTVQGSARTQMHQTHADASNKEETLTRMSALFRRDLRARRCSNQQCTKQASFKAPGTKKKMFCAAHRPAGYV